MKTKTTEFAVYSLALQFATNHNHVQQRSTQLATNQRLVLQYFRDSITAIYL